MRYTQSNRCTKENNQIIQLSFIKCIIVLLEVQKKHTAKYQLCYFLLKFWASVENGNFLFHATNILADRVEIKFWIHAIDERSWSVNVHTICIGTVSRTTIIIRVIVVCSCVGRIRATWSNRP